jgi:ATP-dependent Clp protease ATP-binding subunit ClpC
MISPVSIDMANYFYYSRNMVDFDTARYADIFAALGSQARLAIMQLLFAAYPEGMTVGEIQKKLKIPSSTLSHHLEKLRVEGLVNCTKQKQFLRYSANTKTIEDLLSFLDRGKVRSDRATTPFRSTSDRFHLKGFEKFTQKAIAAIDIARDEPRRLGHSYVGTEQILVGLMGEGSSFAFQLLTCLGVNLENVKQEEEKIIGRGKGLTPLDVPFSLEAKQVLQIAVEESQQLSVEYVGTEHLLLGLLKERTQAPAQRVAIRILQNLGVDLVSLEQQLRQALA